MLYIAMEVAGQEQLHAELQYFEKNQENKGHREHRSLTESLSNPES